MKLLLPWYDLRLTKGVIDAAKHCKVVAIANVFSGPGYKANWSWRDSIAQVHRAGVSVAGYIDAVRWPGDGPSPVAKRRLATKVELADAEQKWRRWYDVGRMFIDDVSESTRQFENSGDLWNWGCEPPFARVKKANVGHHIVHEGHDYLDSDPSPLFPRRQCVIALNEPDFAPVLALARVRGIDLIHISDRRDKTPEGDDDWSTYDEHPIYLIKLAKAIGEIDTAKPSS